jgi:hypothetical protein
MSVDNITGPYRYAGDEFYVKFRDGGNVKEFREAGNVVNDARTVYNFDTYQEMSIFSNTGSHVNENFYIAFGKIFYSMPLPAQVDSLYSQSSYTYFGPPAPSLISAVISYTDENGFVWSTQNPNRDQTGSYIYVNSAVPEGDVGYRYTVKGTFFCTLYCSSSPGQYKTISSGEFTAKFSFGN